MPYRCKILLTATLLLTQPWHYLFGVVRVRGTNNSLSKDYAHPDDQAKQITDTPGLKPFAMQPWIVIFFFSKMLRCVGTFTLIIYIQSELRFSRVVDFFLASSRCICSNELYYNFRAETIAASGSETRTIRRCSVFITSLCLLPLKHCCQ